MESTERAYYAALFRRDFKEAQRLYREVACGDLWSGDRVIREAHKCGIFDEADRDEPETAATVATVAPVTMAQAVEEAVAVVVALETRTPAVAVTPKVAAAA